MKLHSPAFTHGSRIPTHYTCEGPNESPPLIWDEIPSGTKSLALIVTDPDAPANPWVHWVVFDIPPSIHKADEGKIPEGGVEGIANGGSHGYEGPCPPHGEHRYVFELFALDTKLDLPDSVDRQEVLRAMEGHVIEQVQLIGVYQLENPMSTQV